MAARNKERAESVAFLQHRARSRLHGLARTDPLRAMMQRARGLPALFTSAMQGHLMGCHIPTTPSVFHQLSTRIFCGTFAKSGNVYVSAEQQDTMKIFDCSRDRLRLRRTVVPRETGWAILDTAFSPCERFMAYSSWSNCLQLITLDGTIHEALRFCEDFGHVCAFSLVFSSTSRELLCGGNRNTFTLFDVFENRVISETIAHTDDVNAVAYLDDSSNIICTGSDDALCKIWDRRLLDGEGRARPVGCFAGHQLGLTFIDTMNDGRYLLTQGKDCAIMLWDTRKMESVVRPAPQAAQQFDYRWMSADDLPLRFRQSPAGAGLVNSYQGHIVARTLIRARFSPLHSTGQRYIYSGSADGKIYVYDLHTTEVVRVIEGSHGNAICRDVSWHPSLPWLVSAGWDGRLVEHRGAAVGGESTDPTALRTRRARAAEAGDDEEAQEEEVAEEAGTGSESNDDDYTDVNDSEQSQSEI